MFTTNTTINTTNEQHLIAIYRDLLKPKYTSSPRCARWTNSHSIRYPFTTKSLPIIRKALFLTVDRHVLVPVFLLSAEHKHYVVITEQSEVVQVNADIKSERLP